MHPDFVLPIEMEKKILSQSFCGDDGHTVKENYSCECISDCCHNFTLLVFYMYGVLKQLL